MKKIFLLLSIVTLGLYSCDESDQEITKVEDEGGWIQFRSASTAGAEGTSEFLIPVDLVSVTNLEGTVVTYTATDVNSNNNGYLNIGSGSFTIAKDQKVAYIPVTVNENAQITAPIVIDFTLTSTNNNFEVGLSDGSKQVTHRLTVCPNNRDLFLGTYNVIEDDTYEYESVVTAGEADNELVITNIYDSNPNSTTSVFLNLQDGTVTFPPLLDNLLFTSANPAQGNIYVAPATVASTYDACNVSINLNIVLRYGPGQATSTPPISIIMTKQ